MTDAHATTQDPAAQDGAAPSATSTDGRIARLKFGDFYDAQFPRLAWALAYTLGSESLGSKAADHGLGEAHRRWEKVRYENDPEAWVFNRGYRWATAPLRNRRDRKANTVWSGGENTRNDAIARSLQALDIEQRAVVVGHYMLGWSVEELAEAIGKRPKKIDRILDEMRTRLQRELHHTDQTAFEAVEVPS